LLRGVVAVSEDQRAIGPRQIAVVFAIARPAKHERASSEAGYFRSVVSASGLQTRRHASNDRDICLGEIKHEFPALRASGNESQLVSAISFEKDGD
jgi:hypothetical protein